MIIPDKYSSPVMVDSTIQSMQTALEGLTWLEKPYPLVRLTYTDEGKSLPTVYRNDGSMDNYAVMPNDDIKSLSFFRIPERVIVHDVDGDGYDARLEIPVALTVWGRLDRMNVSDRTYDYTSELIQDVLNALLALPDVSSNNINMISEISYVQNTYDVFKDTDAWWDSMISSQSNMALNTFFKIEFTVTTTMICLS